MKGSNGHSARKFLTFGIESTSYKAARAKLMSIKNNVIKDFKAFTKRNCLTADSVLKCYIIRSIPTAIHHLFSIGVKCSVQEWTLRILFVLPLWNSIKVILKSARHTDLYGGLTFSQELPDEILKDFLEIQNLFCINIHFVPLDQVDAMKLVKKNLSI